MPIFKLKNIDALERTIRQAKFVEWTVSGGTEDNTVLTQYDQTLSFEENIALLLQFLREDVGTGQVLFVGKCKPDQKRDIYKVWIPVGTTTETPVQQPQIKGFSEEDIEARISGAVDSAIENYKREQELEELKLQVKDLEDELKERSDVKDAFIGKLLPFIEPVLKGILTSKGMRVGVTGFEDEINDINNQTKKTTMIEENDKPTIEVDDDEEARVMAALAKLQEAEPEQWLNLLEKVANMAAANDSTYKMARNFLVG